MKPSWILSTCVLILTAGAVAGQEPQASSLLIRSLEYYRTGNCSQAVPLFEEILRDQPKNTSVRKLLANCLEQSKRGDEARDQRKRVLSVAPGDLEAAQTLRPQQPAPPPAPVVRLTAEQVERAKAGPDFDVAERLIVAGKLTEAEAALVRIQKSYPQLVLPRLRLAELYSRTKRFDKAAALYSELAGPAGEKAEFLLRAGQNWQWQERYDQAARSYTLYLEKNPNDAAARRNLATSLLWSKNYTGAIQAFQDYLRANPDDFDARKDLGDAFLWSERRTEALDQFLLLQKARPASPSIYLSLAAVYEQTAQLENAMSAYDKALTLDPWSNAAKEGRQRLLSSIPLQKAYVAMEKEDYPVAAKNFRDYLALNPDSHETVLQLARVYSWAKSYDDAAKLYQDYLERKPDDVAALRELAKMELNSASYAAAREHYKQLLDKKTVTLQDYEGMIQAHVWDNKEEDAQAFARKVLARYPASEVANSAVNSYQNMRKQRLRDVAQTLTASEHYAEALQAYRDYVTSFGSDPQTELAICRIYSWNKQADKAILAYQDYLQRFPSDQQARLELAAIELDARNYSGAEARFKEVLKADAGNAAAALGLAKVADYRGDDIRKVVTAYRSSLRLDPQNTTAKEKVEDLAPRVSPSVAFLQRSFADSDGFGRSLNTLETVLALAPGLRLRPYYSFGYFSQTRQIGGAQCGAAVTVTDPKLLSLSQTICDNEGRVNANIGGLSLEVDMRSKVRFRADVTANRFNNGRTSYNGLAELSVDLGGGRGVTATASERDAIYDVNTIGSLLAGIRARSYLLAFQQAIGTKWNFSATGGVTRYSRGYNNLFDTTNQKRIYAQMMYQVAPGITAGYFMRATGFNRQSALYFSPESYNTYGLAYRYAKQATRNLLLNLDGDLGTGRLSRFDSPGVKVVETFLRPELTYRIRPDLSLALAYRFSRGRNSAFGSPVYSTNAIEFSIRDFFMPRISTVDASRLNLQ